MLWRRSAPATELVAVHDAVRPFIEHSVLEKVFAEAEESGAAIVGIVPVDTVKQVHRNKIRQTIPRERLILAQTPQVFRFDLLKSAFAKAREDGFAGTDESSLVERLDQVEVSVVPGSDRNLKITKPSDMDLARLFLAEEMTAQSRVLSDRVLSEFRIGQGWDVHRIVAGRPMILGGVAIPSEFGLEGHSDADILSHAITDALLGALALGDIGMHFPDTDPRWKDGDSLMFLRHARELVAAQGYQIANVDSTVILERPKLKDHRPAIRGKLAETLGVPLDQVSVKFKTAERLGPVGEGLSAEAQAVVLISRAVTIPSPRAEESSHHREPVRFPIGSAGLPRQRSARVRRPGLFQSRSPEHVCGESSRLRARNSGRESRQLHQEPRSAACEDAPGRRIAH